MPVPYEIMDHTGDAAVIVYGETLDELFRNAATAMFELIIDASTIKPTLRRGIEVDAGDLDDLLVRWLSELNYLVEVSREVYSGFEIEHIGENHICAELIGEPIDPARHELRSEIKAVTYHGIHIEKTDAGYETQIIFDL